MTVLKALLLLVSGYMLWSEWREIRRERRKSGDQEVGDVEEYRDVVEEDSGEKQGRLGGVEGIKSAGEKERDLMEFGEDEKVGGDEEKGL